LNPLVFTSFFCAIRASFDARTAMSDQTWIVNRITRLARNCVRYTPPAGRACVLGPAFALSETTPGLHSQSIAFDSPHRHEAPQFFGRFSVGHVHVRVGVAARRAAAAQAAAPGASGRARGAHCGARGRVSHDRQARGQGVAPSARGQRHRGGWGGGGVRGGAAGAAEGKAARRAD
jgi:hypothetical protein